jgi:YD repeat-containing protein
VPERSTNRVQVRTPSQTVTLSWDAAQQLVARMLAAYPTTHPVVDQFRAVRGSRSVELLDANDRTFVLAVIDAWAKALGEDELPQGITDLGSALRQHESI